ncbi:MAG: hypothetical protein JNJ42_19490 [Burkholderiaceae bacterium]|nr:hypothetical protein [Burkholderiaceae bacterium]
MSDSKSPRVAVLYQALPPPTLGGVRKAAKPGGYSDSGADIAFALRAAGCVVATPKAEPDPSVALDWVYPDTEEGLHQALRDGADTLWANTVLFERHPIEALLEDVWVVGQTPSAQQRFDDKFATNTLLRNSGLPVVRSVLVGATAGDAVHGLDDLGQRKLKELGFAYPLVVKPVRGRGSQGVTRVEDASTLARCDPTTRFGRVRRPTDPRGVPGRRGSDGDGHAAFVRQVPAVSCRRAVGASPGETL